MCASTCAIALRSMCGLCRLRKPVPSGSSFAPSHSIGKLSVSYILQSLISPLMGLKDKALSDAKVPGAPSSNEYAVEEFYEYLEKTYDNSNSLKVFQGFKYRSIGETMRDAWLDMQVRGWITADGKGTITPA